MPIILLLETETSFFYLKPRSVIKSKSIYNSLKYNFSTSKNLFIKFLSKTKCNFLTGVF